MSVECCLTISVNPIRLQITEPDVLIQTLKVCLRTSNNHLSSATLSALPAFLPLVLSHVISAPAVRPSASVSTSSTSSNVDAPTLRQVLSAFLPTGGIIDRLGEARERPREKARESLVLIGGFAFRLGGGTSFMARSRSGKETETPLQMFERFLKDGGLGSKVWRVREQASQIVFATVFRTSFPHLTTHAIAIHAILGHPHSCAHPPYTSSFSCSALPLSPR